MIKDFFVQEDLIYMYMTNIALNVKYPVLLFANFTALLSKNNVKEIIVFTYRPFAATTIFHVVLPVKVQVETVLLIILT